jgi:D-3-phosphoglycerate dehydrogenase
MSEAVEALVRDLVSWVAKAPRPYNEVMDIWRTSCPRLPVWEEASDRGLLERRVGEDGTVYVIVTPSGRALLKPRAADIRALSRSA